MIIDCISDLHGFYPELSGGDLLIIAGDLTARDKPGEYDDFLWWLNEQQYSKKILISGNHDNTFQTAEESFFYLIDKMGINYLYDSGTEFEGLHIWGTPWTKTFEGMNPKCKAFTCDTEEELDEKWALIPDDTDILISHGPFWGLLDENDEGIACGSRALRDAVDRVQPRLFICGHIHEQGSNQLIYKHSGPNTWCINCSHVNERYQPVNKPVRITI